MDYCGHTFAALIRVLIPRWMLMWILTVQRFVGLKVALDLVYLGFLFDPGSAPFTQRTPKRASRFYTFAQKKGV